MSTREVAVSLPDQKMTLIHGTVLSTDEENYYCRVQPDKDNIPVLENVPLRVYNFADDFGIIVIPEIDSPCLVTFLDGLTELPVLARCQRWQKIIVKREDIFECVVDPQGNVLVITEGDADIRVKDNVQVQNQSGMMIHLDGSGEKILFDQGDHQVAMTPQGVQIGSAQSSQPFALGGKLLQYLSQLRVICTAPGQLSSTPMPPPTRDLLSDDHFTEK